MSCAKPSMTSFYVFYQISKQLLGSADQCTFMVLPAECNPGESLTGHKPCDSSSMYEMQAQGVICISYNN